VRVLTSTPTLCLSERNYSRSIAQSNEGRTTERALCRVVFFESSEEEKGKRRPNNRPSVSKKAASSGKK
jgi:hypothetical protein